MTEHRIIKCPRCSQPFRIYRHEHGRWTCSGSGTPCPEWERGGHVVEGRCEYPSAQGTRALHAKHGPTIYAYGHWPTPEHERLYSRPIEPLPAPYNRTMP